eukprot:1089788-Pleurochrysis_carterae.AAC.1
MRVRARACARVRARGRACVVALASPWRALPTLAGRRRCGRGWRRTCCGLRRGRRSRATCRGW